MNTEKNKIYWFVFIGNSILLTKSNEIYSIPLSDVPPVPLKPWIVQHKMPEIDGYKCVAFKIDVPPTDIADIEPVALRMSSNMLEARFYQMAGKAAELIYWDSCTRYCGVCGAPMKYHTDISKRCTNCGKEVWPQVCPAIIVRIKRGEKMLLVNAKNFRRREMYGLVAGFVETGETLEDCVRREVEEEVGLRITNIRYFGSQPWPYPCGIMIGFTADYVEGEIKLQETELARAGWFGKDNLPPLPGKESIARMLIDDFIKTNNQQTLN